MPSTRQDGRPEIAPGQLLAVNLYYARDRNGAAAHALFFKQLERDLVLVRVDSVADKSLKVTRLFELDKGEGVSPLKKTKQPGVYYLPLEHVGSAAVPVADADEARALNAQWREHAEKMLDAAWKVAQHGNDFWGTHWAAKASAVTAAPRQPKGAAA